MTRMPSLVRPASGMLLVAALLAIAACWPAVAAAPAIEITIVKPDGKSDAGFLASEARQDMNTDYTFRGPNGEEDVKVTDGVSILSLLNYAEAPIYDTVTIPGPGGRKITLTRGQVEAVQPPGFFQDDVTGKTMFIGAPPMKGADYTEEYFPVAQSAVRITQDKDADLEVDVKASRTKIEPGETVKFTATVSPRGSYRYDWTFEPGAGKKDGGSKVTHRFDEAGTYRVGLGVYMSATDPDADGGGGIKIQVGDPKESDKDREGGGDNTAAGAPTSGTSIGSSGAGSTYDSGPTYTPVPSTPTPPTPTPEPTEPDITTSGTPVEGNLLADASEPPPSNILESARRAARDGNPQDDANDGDVGVSEAAVSVFAALALLGLGAGMETRQGRLPRLRLPRRTG
jgi:hypothetical protein